LTIEILRITTAMREITSAYRNLWSKRQAFHGGSSNRREPDLKLPQHRLLHFGLRMTLRLTPPRGIDVRFGKYFDGKIRDVLEEAFAE
jgi:hypothetical protein